MPRSIPLGALICGVGFAAYATVSLVWTSSQTGWPTVYWATLFLAFGLGLWLRNHALLWYIFCVALSVNLALSTFEQYALGWQFMYGLAGNANYFGCALVLGLAACLVYDIYWFFPIALGALFWVQSRGAIIAAAIVLGLYFWRRFPVTALCCTVIGTIVAFSYANRDISIIQRLGVWQDTFNHLTLVGHGLGAFFTDWDTWPFHTGMTHERPPHAYNDFIELMYDFGLGTLFLWGLFAYALESTRSPLILLAFFALSLTYFPLYIPVLGHLIAATLGHLLATTRKESPQWHVGN